MSITLLLIIITTTITITNIIITTSTKTTTTTIVTTVFYSYYIWFLNVIRFFNITFYDEKLTVLASEVQLHTKFFSEHIWYMLLVTDTDILVTKFSVVLNIISSINWKLYPPLISRIQDFMILRHNMYIYEHGIYHNKFFTRHNITEVFQQHR